MSNWSPLGSGLNNQARALVFVGSSLYAGGNFITAGGVSANYIAEWDGSSWRALGDGLNGVVTSIAWDGITLSNHAIYAGGGFTVAGGGMANNIAMWDGAAWSALGTGIGGSTYSYVYALAWDGANLYAGGSFTTAGGVMANNIAMWDGAAWSALGTGMNGIVYALAWDGTSLYAGGYFTVAGGVAATRVAKWDGANWSALGSGMADGDVYVLLWEPVAGTLYAGGHFTLGGGSPGDRIARWDGAAWWPIESGMNERVLALAWHDPTLYAAGYFSMAGGVTAFEIAQWDSTPETITIIGSLSGCSGVDAVLTAQPSDPTTSRYQWYLDGDTILDATSSVYAATVGGTYIVAAEVYGEPITSASFELRIYDNPEPQIVSIPPGEFIVCEELTVALDAGEWEAYAWFRHGPIVWPSFSSSRTVDVGAGTYSVQVTDSNGCAGWSRYTIEGASLPEPEIVSDPVGRHSVCSGSQITLDAGSFDAYEWFVDDDPASFASSQKVTVGVGTYYVVVTNSIGCRALSVGYNILEYSVTISASQSSDGEVELSAYCPDYSPVGQWYLDGVEIYGATSRYWTAAAPGVYTFSHAIPGGTECWSDSIAVIRTTAVCKLTMVYPGDGVVIASDSTVVFDISDDAMDPVTIDYINLQVYSDAVSPGTYVLIPEITIGSAYVTYVKIANGWRITISGYTFTPDSNLKIQASIIIP